MSKKLFFSGLLILMSTLGAGAQDLLFKKDGTREEVRVVQVGEKEIQYTSFSNPDGPTFSLPVRKASLLLYENDEYQWFGGLNGRSQQNFNRNIFSYHLFDLVFNDFTISYERILESGQIGLKFPLSFGYNDNYTFELKNIFYTGIGLNFYPTGQGKWKYFMGPNLRLGYGKEDGYYYYYDEWGNYVDDEYEENETFYLKFFIDNGVMFMPVPNFSISAIGSLGIRFLPDPEFSEKVRTDGYFSVNLGYRF